MTNNTILVVEDDNDIRNVYQLILQHAKYTVCTAVNGKAALEEVKTCQPKLILLDIFMPVMDGKELLENYSRSPGEHVPVIVCSNTSDQELMRDILALGAEKVINKSTLDPKDLIDLVRPYFD